MAFFSKRDKTERPRFVGDPDEFRLTLIEHLEELRDRIIRSFFIIIGGWVFGWFIWRDVYEQVNKMATTAIRPALPKGAVYTEQFLSFTEPFLLKFHLSFLLGLILVFPLLVFQLWGFVSPALKPTEAKPLKKLVPFIAGLFILGITFAWWIMPSCIYWFGTYVMEFPGTNINQKAGTLVFFTLKMLLGFGLAFQLPLVVYILGALNLLTADTLLRYWRQSATAIFVIAMVATPSQDPVTMLVMAIPLCILFMISVYVVKFIQRKPKETALQVYDGEVTIQTEPEAIPYTSDLTFSDLPTSDEDEDANVSINKPPQDL